MKLKFKLIAFTVLTFSLGSCVDDLNTIPIDPDVETSETVYGTAESYLQGLGKLYAAFSLQGQDGGNSGEIDGVDGGFSAFSRCLWNLQELPTDMSINSWVNNSEIPGLNYLTLTSSDDNELVKAAYYRITFTATLINEYLKQTSSDKLDERGTSDELREDIADYRTQARALRAFMWSFGLDLFGNMPFVTENDPIGVFYPEQATRTELFDYIESELLEIEPLLPEAKTVEFGYLDKGFVWAVLSRLYLNAEVYTGTERYSDCMTWSEKILSNSAYKLATNYAELFMEDNNTSNADVWQELIFTGICDNAHAVNYGGTTFILNGSRDGSDAREFGAPAGWQGYRARRELVQLFAQSPTEGDDGYVATDDSRCRIYAKGRTLDVVDPSDFFQGYSVYKYMGTNSQGEFPSTGDANFSSTDWVFLRMGEIYLNYAEAALRSGSNLNQALEYVNTIRERAYKGTSGNITSSQLTLDFLINERGRELYWEGTRRSDLIRFDMFTGSNYIWSWKGNVPEGTSVDSHYTLYPIPYLDLVANPNLKQNAGY